MFDQTKSQQDQIDWGRINEDGIQASSSISYESKQKSIFIKFKSGIHKVRLLPTGNKLDRIPYLKVSQHTIQANIDNRQKTMFAWCWNALWDNLISKETDEERKNNTLIGYLFKQQKLNNDEMKKFQEYGCPFCKAFGVMDQYGIAKETKNKFLKKEQYLWNILYRATPGNGDNLIYVYGQSKTHFNTVIAHLKMCKENGMNALDMNAGHDLVITANGDGLMRRYNVMFNPASTPVDIGQEIPYDLAEIASGSFKPYGEMVQMLKLGGGKVLQELGYIIPGDMVVASSPAAALVKEREEAQPTPVKQLKVDNGEAIDIGGTLYQKMSDGTLKPLF